jgi:hypothetical protein
LRNLPVYGSKKKIRNNKTLPSIKCSCGFEILLVHNVKVLSEAIESHVENHKQKVKNPKDSETEAERIRVYLVTQAIEKASKS